MNTMKAAVIHEPGGADVLKLESRPIPTPRTGEVLIRVKAFGLNRSELFTRQGHSPNVAGLRPICKSSKARSRIGAKIADAIADRRLHFSHMK
jgi:NADPH:quinone reductase-like Zn-dependent oxidoreductase